MNCGTSVVTVAAVFLVAATLGAVSADADDLRLVGMAGGQTVQDVVVIDRELHFRAPDGSTPPVPRDTRWFLEGDLLQHASKFDFGARFEITRRPARPVGDRSAVHIFGVVEYGGNGSWKFDRRQVAVFAWLVDGRVTQIAVAPRHGSEEVGATLPGWAVFELQESEARGRGVVLLWQEGEWLPSEQPFEEMEVNAALHQFHLDPAARAELLLAGTKPDRMRDRSERRPILSVLAGQGLVEPVRWALEHGANPHQRSPDNSLALHEAAARGYTDIVELLIRHGARPLATDGDRSTAIDHAVRHGHLDTARSMLGAEPSGEVLRLVFGLALEQVDAPAIAALLERGGKKLVRSMRPENFRACLAQGDAALLRLLLDAGLVADRADLILAAACSSRTGIMQMLRDAGADLNRTASEGTSALFIAAARGDIAMLELLLGAGADPNARNKQGETPLGLATAAGHGEVQARLRTRGAAATNGATKRSRAPDQRWLTDMVRPPGEPIHPASEVDQAPIFRTGDRSEFVGTEVKSVLRNEQSYAGDPYTGAVYPVVRTVVDRYTTQSVTASTWAIVSFVVETDGATTGADIVAVSSPEHRIAVERVLGSFVFEPGKRGGQAVRTRIAVAIDMPR